MFSLNIYPRANDGDETDVLCIPFLLGEVFPVRLLLFFCLHILFSHPFSSFFFSFCFFSTDNDEVNRPDLYARLMSDLTKEKKNIGEERKHRDLSKTFRKEREYRGSDDLPLDFLSSMESLSSTLFFVLFLSFSFPIHLSSELFKSMIDIHSFMRLRITLFFLLRARDK